MAADVTLWFSGARQSGLGYIEEVSGVDDIQSAIPYYRFMSMDVAVLANEAVRLA